MSEVRVVSAGRIGVQMMCTYLHERRRFEAGYILATGDVFAVAAHLPSSGWYSLSPRQEERVVLDPRMYHRRAATFAAFLASSRR